MMNLLEQYWKLIAGLFIAVVVVGSGYVLVSGQSVTKEKKVQENYFTIEKKLLELKNKAAATLPDKKAEPVDYAPIKKELETFALANIGTTAAQMAGLHLSQLYIEENKNAEALELLQKLSGKDRGLVNTLVQQQVAQLLAGQDKCQEAITVWQNILDRKEASFLHNEMKLQQALCYAKLNDMKKAEELLLNLSNQTNQADFGASAASKEAEKYLRLLQFKKAFGS